MVVGPTVLCLADLDILRPKYAHKSLKIERVQIPQDKAATQFSANFSLIRQATDKERVNLNENKVHLSFAKQQTKKE